MSLREEVGELFREYRATNDQDILEKAEAKQVFEKLSRERPRWQARGNTTYFLGRGTTDLALGALAVVLRHARGLSATIIKYQEPPPHSHLYMVGIVLTNGNHTFVVPDGFAEGYSGQGPRGLRTARVMLKGIPTEEKVISKNEFDNIFKNCNRED